MQEKVPVAIRLRELIVMGIYLMALLIKPLCDIKVFSMDRHDFGQLQTQDIMILLKEIAEISRHKCVQQRQEGNELDCVEEYPRCHRITQQTKWYDVCRYYDFKEIQNDVKSINISLRLFVDLSVYDPVELSAKSY